MEMDNEVKGVGTAYNFGARIHDPRLGRFLSVDPLASELPFYSPYLFAGNKPVWKADELGYYEVIRNVEDHISEDANGNLIVNFRGIDNETRIANGGSIRYLSYLKDGILLGDPEDYWRQNHWVLGYRVSLMRVRAYIQDIVKNEALTQSQADHYNQQLAAIAAKTQELYELHDLIRTGEDDFRASVKRREMKRYLEQVEYGRSKAFFDITIGGTGLILSGVAIYGTSGVGSVPAYASAIFSADQVSSGVLTLRAIDFGMFDPDREYALIKGVIVDSFGEDGGLLYDLASLGVSLASASGTLDKLTGPDLKVLLDAIAVGSDAVNIQGQTVNIVKRVQESE